jgi:hypothetical protein
MYGGGQPDSETTTKRESDEDSCTFMDADTQEEIEKKRDIGTKLTQAKLFRKSLSASLKEDLSSRVTRI